MSNSSILLCILAMLMSPLAVVADAVDFELSDMEGNQRRLSEFRGKWVLVNYWATWCPPCREEMPALEIFHNNHQDRDAVVLGVNMEQITQRRLQAFIEEQFISYPILRSKPGRLTALGEVPGLPTSYVVSPEGEVLARQVGPVTAEMLEAFLARQIQRRQAQQE